MTFSTIQESNMEVVIDPDVTLSERDYRSLARHQDWLKEYCGTFLFYISDRFDVATSKTPRMGRPRKTEKIIEIDAWKTSVGYHPKGWTYPYSSTVQRYHTEEEARQGHDHWVKFMRENRDIDPYEFKEWASRSWTRHKDQSMGGSST